MKSVLDNEINRMTASDCCFDDMCEVDDSRAPSFAAERYEIGGLQFQNLVKEGLRLFRGDDESMHRLDLLRDCCTFAMRILNEEIAKIDSGRFSKGMAFRAIALLEGHLWAFRQTVNLAKAAHSLTLPAATSLIWKR